MPIWVVVGVGVLMPPALITDLGMLGIPGAAGLRKDVRPECMI